MTKSNNDTESLVKAGFYIALVIVFVLMSILVTLMLLLYHIDFILGITWNIVLFFMGMYFLKRFRTHIWGKNGK